MQVYRIVRHSSLLDVFLHLSIVAQLAINVEAIRLAKFDVSSVVRVGGRFWLKCAYDLEGDALYSLKYFKDDHELYRLTPGDKPREQVFTVEGVDVDENESTEANLLLSNVTPDSSGTYRCEVKAAAPSIETVFVERTVTVKAVTEDLRITEFHVPSLATVGDDVILTCKHNSGRSGVYSVQWLQNSLEFYRYDSRHHPPKQEFDSRRRNVEVKLNESSESTLSLKILNPEAAGTYECKVYGHPPSFESAYNESTMEVKEFPKPEIEELDVPQTVRYGEEVAIDCNYDLKGNSLMSLQWQKENRTFYMYNNYESGNLSDSDVIPIKGVYVNKDQSSVGRVVLSNITALSFGRYTCVLTTHPPSSYIVTSAKHMMVKDEIPLQISKMIVPSEVISGSEARLGCQHDLPSDTLYTVTWYINDQWFYKYSPGERASVYPLEGILVDVDQSSNGLVVLKNMTTSGTYTCEISAAPLTFSSIRIDSSISVK